MLCKLPEGVLVEQSEAHVVIFLRLRLWFLGSGGSSWGSFASGSRTSGSWGSSGRDGAELLSSLLDQLIDILPGQLGHHLVHLLVIGVDTNGAEQKGLVTARLRYKTEGKTNLRIFLMLAAETSCPPWAASRAAAT